MRKTIEVNGIGASMAQARTHAYAQLKNTYKNNVLVYGLINTEQIVAPKPGTQCSTLNNPPTGARKWLTKYLVVGKNPANNELKQLGPYYDDKAQASKAAKELCIKHQIECHVDIAKIDEAVGKAGLPATTTAVITPKMTPGTWRFVLDIETVEVE